MSVDYFGLPVRTLRNKKIQIDFLANAGPRIVRLMVDGKPENLLSELPNLKRDTPYGLYRFHGGHRLWHSPEQMPRSYLPDNEGLVVEEKEDGVHLTQPVEPFSGIRKSMQIFLHPEKPEIIISHQLKNEGAWTVELAPWAVTMIRPGGLAIIPWQEKNVNKEDLLSDRNLVVWPYTDIRDERLTFNDDFILIDVKPKPTSGKIGIKNKHGWIGYLYKDILFRKIFSPQLDKPLVDFGCNAESYFCGDFIELETIAPLSRLEPGQTSQHLETWEFTSGLNYPANIDGVRRMVSDLKL